MFFAVTFVDNFQVAFMASADTFNGLKRKRGVFWMISDRAYEISIRSEQKWNFVFISDDHFSWKINISPSIYSLQGLWNFEHRLRREKTVEKLKHFVHDKCKTMVTTTIKQIVVVFLIPFIASKSAKTRWNSKWIFVKKQSTPASCAALIGSKMMKFILLGEFCSDRLLFCIENHARLFFSDDKVLYKWSADTRQATQVAKLPDDFEPTDLQWLYSSRSSSKSTGGSSTNNGNAATDSLLISSSDGRFIMLNRNARVERIVNAHQESVNAIRWSPDASGLLTAGEDGIIKIWSKLGMLRSTIVQNEESVRTACWSPNSMSIAYCTGQFIAIKPLAANSKLSKVILAF